MNKTELIENLSNYLDIAETEQKIFIEMFLKNISRHAKLGQSIYVEGFGHFYHSKCKIQNAQLIESIDEMPDEIDVIVFTESAGFSKNNLSGLVFDVPVIEENEVHSADAAFTLSFGKPLIPLRGVPLQNLLRAQYGYESKKIIEGKVDRIIEVSETSKPESDKEELIIDGDLFSLNSINLKWKSKNIQTIDSKISKEPDESDSFLNKYQRRANELVNAKWNFDGDVEKQISKNVLPELKDVIVENNLIENESTTATKTVSDEKSNQLEEVIDNVVLPKKNTDDDFIIEEIFYDEEFDKTKNDADKLINQDIEEIIIFEPDELKTKANLIEIGKEPEPQIVESIQTVINIIDAEQTDGIELESTTKADNFISNDELEIEDNEPEVLNDNSEVKPDESLALEFVREVESDKQLQNEDEDIKNEVITKADNQFVKNRNKKKYLLASVISLLLFAASAGIYWYLEIYIKKQPFVKPKELALNIDNANIIKREFDLPVTYPYLPKNSVNQNPDTVIKSIDDKSAIEKQKPVNPVEQPVKNDKPKTNQIQTGKGQLVDAANFIYNYNGVYVVQVASLKNKSTAESEAARYRNKGYNSFVEKAEVANRGLWYRVKVGNFSSLDEAKKFIEKK